MAAADRDVACFERAGETALSTHTLLAAGADSEPADRYGNNVLTQVEIRRGLDLRGKAGEHEAIARLLAAAGARADSGKVELVLAVHRGDAAALRQLLETGGDASARGHDGTPVLLTATVAGHAEIVDLLLSTGAKASVGAPPARLDARARLTSGPAALHKAVERDDLPMVKKLVAAGADPAMPAQPGRPETTPRGLASYRGYKSIARWIAQHGR